MDPRTSILVACDELENQGDPAADLIRAVMDGRVDVESLTWDGDGWVVASGSLRFRMIGRTHPRVAVTQEFAGEPPVTTLENTLNTHRPHGPCTVQTRSTP